MREKLPQVLFLLFKLLPKLENIGFVLRISWLQTSDDIVLVTQLLLKSISFFTKCSKTVVRFLWVSLLANFTYNWLSIALLCYVYLQSFFSEASRYLVASIRATQVFMLNMIAELSQCEYFYIVISGFVSVFSSEQVTSHAANRLYSNENGSKRSLIKELKCLFAHQIFCFRM